MTHLAFAARIVRDAGDTKTSQRVPQRVTNPTRAVLVENPFTGHDLWLAAEHVVNRVNGVASVVMPAVWSGREKKITRGHREFLNPLTGNTFLVKTTAIIKETS